MICFFRKMGKILFLDEDKLHVPLIVGSLTDEGFVSADNCYLRNSQMGESWGIPHCLCACQAYTNCTVEITLVKWRLQTADALHQHTHGLCNQLFTADMPPVFSSHRLHNLSSLHKCQVSCPEEHAMSQIGWLCIVPLWHIRTPGITSSSWGGSSHRTLPANMPL